MIEGQYLAAPDRRSTTEFRPRLQGERPELTRTLNRARVAYRFDPSLGDALDSFVTRLRREGHSVDDAIKTVGTMVRAIRPAIMSTDVAFERTWRTYFALYDTAIRRTIRTFVIGGVEDDARIADAIDSEGASTRSMP